eukprot:GSChrysophyteH1.ASY1.ANO1.2407.1 assembled CDS
MKSLIIPLLYTILIVHCVADHRASDSVYTKSTDIFNKKEIESLPGWDHDLPSRMYSGYLEASDTSRLFYVYVEAEDVAPELAPLSLWLNGGPGCSSFDGFWEELGPFSVKSDGSLQLRPYRWNRYSNMLFIESPVGVGFSFSLDKNYTNNDDRTAIENAEALRHFFKLFPDTNSKPFFLSGESYAGIYVPTLAQAILDRQKNGTWEGPSVSGIAVGNGCTGKDTGICGFYEGNSCDGLWYENFKANTAKPDGWAAQQNFTMTIDCTHLLDEAFRLVGHEGIGKLRGKMNNEMQDINSQLDALSFPGRELATPLDDDPFRSEVNKTEGPAECIGSYDASRWMNEHFESINAKKSFCWGVCKRIPKLWQYNATRENLPRDLYPRLIGNMDVLIYNGDVDSCVPYTDNEAWTENMGYSVSQAWAPWAVTYDVSDERDDNGSIRPGRTFTFLTVRGAGHMVPQTQPAAALEMWRRFLGYDPIDIVPKNGPSEECSDNILEEILENPEAAATVTALIFLLLLTMTSTAWFYLKSRQLQAALNGEGGQSSPRRGGVDRGNTFDTRLDISDREVQSPFDYDDEDVTIEMNQSPTKVKGQFRKLNTLVL